MITKAKKKLIIMLMFFILFCSILGMHLFGCKFSLQTDNGDTIPDRKNFDTLLWAIVTVFQVSFLLRTSYIPSYLALYRWPKYFDI